MTAQLADAQTGKVVDSLTATPEHPFFVPGRGAIPLGQLGIGTQVVTRAGPPLVIASLVKHKYPQGIPVYNFEVQGDHTYFVGVANGGTWVHNTCVPRIVPGSLPAEEEQAVTKTLQHFDAGGNRLPGEGNGERSSRTRVIHCHRAILTKSFMSLKGLVT